MLTLRTSIGLTQEGLAEVLSVSRKAIGRWKAGETYPKAAHLQVLLALALQHGAFVAGEEEEAIRAFWRAAHQKVLLDEAWLHELLREHVPLRKPVPAEQLNAHRLTVSREWIGERRSMSPAFMGERMQLVLLQENNAL